MRSCKLQAFRRVGTTFWAVRAANLPAHVRCTRCRHCDGAAAAAARDCGATISMFDSRQRQMLSGLLGVPEPAVDHVPEHASVWNGACRVPRTVREPVCDSVSPCAAGIDNALAVRAELPAVASALL